MHLSRHFPSTFEYLPGICELKSIRLVTNVMIIIASSLRFYSIEENQHTIALQQFL